jgi:pimeloyl-ACP methyl ester carboxylesterase
MKIDTGGFQINYEVAGAPGSPTMLLVHGILQSAQRWAEMGYLETFADRYRVVAIDLLGHGQSDKPHDAAHYTADTHVDALRSVLEAEDAQRCVAWGYSGGAAVVAALAAAEPHRVQALVLGGIPPKLPVELREPFIGPWIDALRAGDWVRFWELFLPIDETTKALLQEANDPLAVASFLQGAMETDDLLPATASVPSLVYMGTKELFFEDARSQAEFLGAEFVPIEDRGHAGTFQDLAAVGPLVRGFLDRTMVKSAAGAQAQVRGDAPDRRALR